MTWYIAYDSSGRIIGDAESVEYLDKTLLFISLDDCPVAIGCTHYVLNGKLLPKGLQPLLHFKFNYTSKQWEDPRSLQDLKTAKNLFISASRLKANQSTFTFTGKQIAVDPLSRGDIDAVHGIVVLSNGMPDNWVGGWKAIDNTFVSIPDVATWTLFYKAMVGQGSINFAHAQDLKAQLAAATTIEEVDAIVW